MNQPEKWEEDFKQYYIGSSQARIIDFIRKIREEAKNELLEVLEREVNIATYRKSGVKVIDADTALSILNQHKK